MSNDSQGVLQRSCASSEAGPVVAKLFLRAFPRAPQGQVCKQHNSDKNNDSDVMTSAITMMTMVMAMVMVMTTTIVVRMINTDANMQGMGHVIGFCGDGFNDIPAIHATDVGIAVSASEAALTAPVFTSDASAKGEHEMLRCNHVHTVRYLCG